MRSLARKSLVARTVLPSLLSISPQRVRMSLFAGQKVNPSRITLRAASGPLRERSTTESDIHAGTKQGARVTQSRRRRLARTAFLLCMARRYISAAQFICRHRSTGVLLGLRATERRSSCTARKVLPCFVSNRPHACSSAASVGFARSDISNSLLTSMWSPLFCSKSASRRKSFGCCRLRCSASNRMSSAWPNMSALMATFAAQMISFSSLTADGSVATAAAFSRLSTEAGSANVVAGRYLDRAHALCDLCPGLPTGNGDT
mmetsp:Transcript_2915/g.8926  ORF Transcript_2915/g.8926 Transcript_2915/m.8926 type:complete len:261 (+) Transcript_2915:1240-2022(+)